MLGLTMHLVQELNAGTVPQGTTNRGGESKLGFRWLEKSPLILWPTLCNHRGMAI